MASIHNPYSDVQNNVNQALNDLVADETVYVPTYEAQEIFHLPDSVQIFFIGSDGKVSTFSEPSTLRIFKFKQKKEGEPDTFIQVNGWTHPLGPDHPVLKAQQGSFMFPDAYGDIEGAAIGLVILDESPFNVDGEAEHQLEKLLQELTALKKEELSKDTQNVDDLRLGKYGKIIFKTAEKLGNVVESGAQKATKLIEYQMENQKAKTQPAEKDTKINPVVKTSIKGAKFATNATVKVSGYVANRVGDLTKRLSNHLAKKLEPSVTGTVTGVSGGAKTKGSSMHNLIDAARGGLLAYGTVYSSLEDSAKVLGNSLKNNSVQVVEHKYGGEAGHVYGDAMTAAGDAAMTYLNIQSLGVKGLVKKTAKNTGKQLGKAVLDAHVEKKSN